jgi:hypothetical protein
MMTQVVVDADEMAKVMKGERIMSTRRLWGAGAAMTILASSIQAFGAEAVSTQSFDSLGTLVGPLAGDVRCQRFAPRAEVLELKVNKPGQTFSLTDGEGQEIEGAIRNGQLQFTATQQIYATIVRGKKRSDDEHLFNASGNKGKFPFGLVSNAYIFGRDGTLSDFGETAPDMGEIQQVRFCYGLTEEPQELPRCTEIEDGPQCPVVDEAERNGTLVFFDFDQLNFGGEARPCVCGNTVLLNCNESLPADEPGTCAGGVLQKVEVMYVLTKNPDSKVCKTIDGERICFRTPD